MEKDLREMLERIAYHTQNIKEPETHFIFKVVIVVFLYAIMDELGTIVKLLQAAAH